jgi:DNA-binding NarL/FixJ family response regulator
MDTNITITIIEDNQSLRKLIAYTLRSHDYHVVEADSAESLDQVNILNQSHLLILDLNLPGEDGLSIALRAKSANPDLFIIMLTARHTELDRINGYNQGADIYLSKPVSQNELLAAIKSLERRIRVTWATKVNNNIDTSNILFEANTNVNTNSEAVKLTPMQLKVLALIARGHSNKLIAKYLDISEQTVKIHSSQIFKRLEVDNRTQAVLKAQSYSLI